MPAMAAAAADPLSSVRREKLILAISLELSSCYEPQSIRAGRRQVICDLGRLVTLIAASGSGGNIRVYWKREHRKA
jgi:hypothetical protein